MAPMKMGSARKSSGDKPLAKGQFMQAIADKVGCKKKDVAAMIEAQTDVAMTSLAKAGKVTIPGLVMIKTRNKPATKACVKTMFGVERKVPAMKAKTVVKALPIKAVKDQYK